MAHTFALPKSRFRWSAFQGRCRIRLLVGLLLLVIAVGYASYAGQRMAHRGTDDKGFDVPLVRLAHGMTPPPVHMRGMQPQNDRELYLITVVSDQQDMMFGLTALVLRMIASLTIGGVGLVLLAAGSVEWEIRSEA
jgi:hypothetical protein